MKAQYIRVSTLEQNTERQAKITGAKQYLDKISGTVPLFERPQGKKLFKDMEDGRINEVLYIALID